MACLNAQAVALGVDRLLNADVAIKLILRGIPFAHTRRVTNDFQLFRH